MKTLILPGYSAHNRDWALEIAGELENAQVHEWTHWETGGRMDPAQELKAIAEKIAGNRVNLLAKSVGCRMAANTVMRQPGSVKKLVLCGLPSTDDETLADMKGMAANLAPDRILILQNREDPYAPFDEVQAFFEKVNPAISVLERPRKDHHYPYAKDFKAFITGLDTD